MQYGDLVDFILNNPDRLGELTEIILVHPRGELTGWLQTAAESCGYVYENRAWVTKSAPPDETPAAADQVDDEQLVDQDLQAQGFTLIDQVEQPAVLADETRVTGDQVEQAAARADEIAPTVDLVDGEQLAEQLDEVTPATANTKAKAKPAKTRSSTKAAAPAQASKPAKAKSTAARAGKASK